MHPDAADSNVMVNAVIERACQVQHIFFTVADKVEHHVWCERNYLLREIFLFPVENDLFNHLPDRLGTRGRLTASGDDDHLMAFCAEHGCQIRADPAFATDNNNPFHRNFLL
jgi:hypothetical protein